MFFSWSMVLWFRRSWTIPKMSLFVDPAEELSPSCQRWKLSNLALFEPSAASLLEVLYHFFGMIDGWLWRTCDTVVKRYEAHFVREAGYCLVWLRSCAYSVLEYAFLEDTLHLFCPLRCVKGLNEPSWWHPFWSIHHEKLRPHPRAWLPTCHSFGLACFPKFWGFKSLDAWFSADQGWACRCWLLRGVKVAF